MARPNHEPERQHTGRMHRRLWQVTIAIGLALTLSCLADPFTGSLVQADFLTGMVPSATVRMPTGEASHYQLWVQFNEEGVYSIGAFIVNAEVDPERNLVGEEIFSYPDVETRIGTLTGAVDLRRSGVRWTVPADLHRATHAFVTLEEDGQTSFAPSGVVIMEGELFNDAPNTLRGTLEGAFVDRLGQTQRPVARVTILMAEDDVFF